jgi:hypothetical protein
VKIEQRPAGEVTKMENPLFRRALCVKPGFRYSALKPYCQRIEFITDGFATDVESISKQIAETLNSYDPDIDVLVPTGTGIVNMLIGYYIANKFPDSSVAVAFFQKEVTKYNRTVVPEDYEFYRFYPTQSMNLWG